MPTENTFPGSGTVLQTAGGASGSELIAQGAGGSGSAGPHLTATGAGEVVPTYFCVLTDAGADLEAQAHATGIPVRLTHVAVGDGNGDVPTPAPDVTALVHEVHRRGIDTISQDETDRNIAWIHAVFPADVGGFWIREFGVYAENPDGSDAEPILFAYGNHAPYYKMLISLGQAVTHDLSIPLVLSSAADVQIVIAEAGYATRLEYLHLAAIVEALRHPRAASWTLADAVPEGGELNLPAGVSYVPGRNLLRLSWEGCLCHPGLQYEEIPAPGGGPSDRLRLLFPAAAGDELHIAVQGYSDELPLPDGGIELAGRVNALENRLETVASNALYLATPEPSNPKEQSHV